MRRYFIHLTNIDFTAQASDSHGSTWTTDPFDLYRNDSYTNYSTTKSSYGLNSLSTSTWVGLVYKPSVTLGHEWEDWSGFTWGELSNQTWAQNPTEVVTDTGLIVNGRYIDTSGRVNILSWSIETNSVSPLVTPTLTFYNTWDPDFVFPDEWAQTGPINVGDELDVLDANRYGVVSLRFNNPPGITFDFDLKIRVEIDVPVMVPTFQRSLNLFKKFPSWMDMRELGILGEIQGATPALATPQSLGGKLINDAAGEWLDDLYAQMTYLYYQRFIDTADLSQMAWAYQTSGVPQFVVNVQSSGANALPLSQAVDLKDLLEALPSENVYWWDEDNRRILTNKNYEGGIYINDNLYPQAIYQIWNFLDEIGLQVSLSRLSGEANDSFAARIKDVFASGLGTGIDSFKKTLRRELNLWGAYGASPDSNYLGATPDILEIRDIEKVLLHPGATPYLDPTGLPTQRFKDLVEYLETNFPITWGNFPWDQSVWDPSGPDYQGFHQVPLQADATPMSGSNYQSGVGDGEDLLLYSPDKVIYPHTFTGRLLLRGKKLIPKTLYTPVRVNFEVLGKASRIFYNNPETTIWLSLEATLIGDPNIYVASFQMSATSDADVDKPLGTSASLANKNIFTQGGITHRTLSFLNKATRVPRGSLNYNNIATLTLTAGRWDFPSLSYIDLPPSDVYQSWFSTLPGSYLNFSNQVGPDFPNVTTQVVTPTLLPSSQVVLQSTQISSAPGTWSSVPQKFSIIVNNVSPYSQPNSTTFRLPVINWDPYTTGGFQYVIRLLDQQQGTFGAFATNAPNEGANILTLNPDAITFLNQSYIQIDGSSNWSINSQNVSGDLGSIVFSIKNQSLYPFVVKTWELFQVSQNQEFTGIVDENGPWRNGRGIPPGNGNYALEVFSLDRSNFGLPDTLSYIVTWMGVEVLDDPQVILWLDTNTVQPAVSDGSNLTYPVGSIVESLNGSRYQFSPVLVKARLRTTPSPQWYPQVHSGYFYENQKEYYLFAQATPEHVTGLSPILSGIPRQGAPIIVYTNEATPRYLRQVSFPTSTESATPAFPLNYATPSSITSLSLVNTETVSGTGTNNLYISYPDTYNISVTDSQSGASYTLASTTASPYNVVGLNTITDPALNYNVSYTVNNSFWVDTLYEDYTSTQKAQLHFDKSPAQNGVSDYIVWYEHSYLNPATPVPIPLNPFFTTINNGFLYISHDEFNLAYVLIFISPHKILADGQDQMLVTVHSLDQLENPKPNQTFLLSTNFGTFDKTTITTNVDGFALATLTAGNSLPVGGATPTISGLITVTAQNPSNVFTSTSVPFEIVPPSVPSLQLLATVGADQVPADGKSLNVVYGRIEDGNYKGIGSSFVRWKRARSLYELFKMDPQFGIATPSYGSTPFALYPGVPSTPPYTTDTTYGEVLTGIDGEFTIGPFTAATPDRRPGYWFLAAEAKEATPSGAWKPVGDVVFWNEYPAPIAGIEDISGQIVQPIQLATPIGVFPDYTGTFAFPVTYKNDLASATPVNPIWLPSIWYAINRYEQYQLGLLGDLPNSIDDKSLNLRNPDWNEI